MCTLPLCTFRLRNCAKAQGEVGEVLIAGLLLWKQRHMHSVERSLQLLVACMEEKAVWHLGTAAFWREPTCVQSLKLWLHRCGEMHCIDEHLETAKTGTHE